jgi:hypothetical protein
MTKTLAGATQTKSLTTWDYIWVSAVLAGLAWCAVQAVRWVVHRAEIVQAQQSGRAPATATSSVDLDDRFKVMNAKVAGEAATSLDRSMDAESYAKLGARVWAVSNEYRRWAALSAAESDACDKVDAVAVWDRATRNSLSWRVTCRNGERFIIPEAQARSVRAQFDPAATLADRKRYAAIIEIARPVSAIWRNFSDTTAVAACERVMKEAAVNRASFDGSGMWGVNRDEERGLATIVRDYSASNALGGTLSGKYQCIVNAADGSVVSLKARDALGLHSVVD